MFNFNYLLVSLIAAITATLAATLANSLSWPVWAMFIGWVAFYTGKHTLPGIFTTYGCLALGIIIANFAGLAIASLAQQIGFWSITPVVFVVALVIVSLRGIPLFNNIPSYFLGMIAFIAAHMPVGISSTMPMLIVTAVGIIAAFCTAMIQGKLIRSASDAN
ncbi:DUF1097 domain-containing protein [Agarivorans sp. Toyoura001]|uniref:DUF1097 domain-containing protein n=1 Tax=unclassified Agarivorans TaxID=2636026 RepID=UPI0010D1C614|nr:DUF1097 domain-containing protein [Agarivorans sp. Toyoura001]GDY25423.1 hypothetical protein AHAT_13130 [Agarivorans sp. Toyoura001]